MVEEEKVKENEIEETQPDRTSSKKLPYYELAEQYGIKLVNSKLTPQDFHDLKEIEKLEELATLNGGGKLKGLGKGQSHATDSEDDLENYIIQSSITNGPPKSKPRLTLMDPKNYLEMKETSDGGRIFQIFIPPFDLEALKNGFKTQLTVPLKPELIQKMQHRFDQY